MCKNEIKRIFIQLCFEFANSLRSFIWYIFLVLTAISIWLNFRRLRSLMGWPAGPVWRFIHLPSELHQGNYIYSWSKTWIFAASNITRYWLDNAIIIIFYWQCNHTFTGWKRQKLFFKNCKQSRIQQNLYTAFEWIWWSNLQNFIFS